MERHRRSRSAPFIPPRRRSHNTTSPPVPSRWGTCFSHSGKGNVAICKTCITLLCDQCLPDVQAEHKHCAIAFLNSNIDTTCKDVTSNLINQIGHTQHTLKSFHRNLASKKERMVAKKSETIAEIERYFVHLKEKILHKLRREEDDLLAHLNEKVADQERVISENIENCRDTIGVIEEKKTCIKNISRLSVGVHPDVSMIGTLKNIIQASDEVKLCCKSQKEIEAARDGFLVIRFFVDSETEETILNSKVASVEILNSAQADCQEAGNLEVERITEAAQSVGSDHSSRTSPESDSVHEDLRVILPPVRQRERSTSPVHSRQNSRPELGRNSACERSSPANTTDGSSERRSSNIEGRAEDAEQVEVGASLFQLELPTPSAASPVELIDIEVNADVTATLSPSSSSSTSSTPSSVFPPVVADTQILAETRDPGTGSSTTGQDGNSEGDDLDVENDPPPPYPGLPRTTPRPDERPPPYPGPPPPPYSRNPTPQASPAYGSDNVTASASTSQAGIENVERALIPAAEFCNLQEISPRPRGNKITKVFSVNEVYDKRSAGIFALAVVRGNGFVVVDRWNRKLKYFNSSGVSYGGLIFREEPWDVTLITNELVAVTVPKMNMLYTIKVTEQSVKAISTVSTSRKYACVAYHEPRQVFVCGQVPQFGEPVIDVISVEGGAILQSFRHDSHERRDTMTFSYPRYVKVTEDGIVIVCDWNIKCIMMFKLDGTSVGRYRGTVEFPLNEPTGMAYDPDKREIYVIDSKHTRTSAAIHTVSLTCECKDIIRWESDLRVAPAISACQPGFAVGSKSGAVSLFRPSSRNSLV
ncbi:uncharacterized protein LOC128239241 [Mya arenaria]|uniref:uncharacterized protein LOC128239241 n=1 Tax=Mya arenaria TaxID=6604 RepID=UPI0022E20015|nr:uncharacterized protein LOC128239241 [Mya arenaria]XP_052811762.1 uncharacterized protein LOC128239241 [Mya arenaria]